MVIISIALTRKIIVYCVNLHFVNSSDFCTLQAWHEAKFMCIGVANQFELHVNVSSSLHFFGNMSKRNFFLEKPEENNQQKRFFELNARVSRIFIARHE